MKRTAVTFALIPLSLHAGLALAGEETIRLEVAPGSELTSARCVVCHSLDYIQMNAAVMNRASWKNTVRKMIDRFGAPISEAEAAQIQDYLAMHYITPGG